MTGMKNRSSQVLISTDRTAIPEAPPPVWYFPRSHVESRRWDWSALEHGESIGDDGRRADRGTAHWGAIGYGLVLSLLQLMVLAWLFARSPRHRLIAVEIILTSLSIIARMF